MDGKDFRYVAGSFHYFRALPQTWRTKLKTLRAGGLNAVDLYVQWSLHNPKENQYVWDGIANIKDVIEAAIEADLYVILRPGPYICAEIDNVSIYLMLVMDEVVVHLFCFESKKMCTVIFYFIATLTRQVYCNF